MLEPDGNAHQSVADAKLGALRRGEPLMRGRRWMGDQALGVAEIVTDAYELQRVLKTERGFLAAVDFESDQRRAAAHLLLRNGSLRMIGPARIDQSRNLWMFGKRHRECRRAVGLPPHPHRERLKTLEQHPGIERRHRRAGLA